MVLPLLLFTSLHRVVHVVTSGSFLARFGNVDGLCRVVVIVIASVVMVVIIIVLVVVPELVMVVKGNLWSYASSLCLLR